MEIIPFIHRWKVPLLFWTLSYLIQALPLLHQVFRWIPAKNEGSKFVNLKSK